MNIEVKRLYALLLIPLVMGLLYYVSKKFSNIRKNDKFILICRIICLILIICSIADITLNLKGKNTETVFLLDVSDSMADFKDEGLKFIDNSLKEMPENNKSAVILFGSNAVTDKFMDTSKTFSELKSEPNAIATDIEEAVKQSFLLFDKRVSKRIVLITDGEENKGDILKCVNMLKKENVDLKIYKVQNARGSEVYVDEVTVPENISIGEEFSVVTKIESNVKTNAKLTLFCGRDKKGEQKIILEKGTNTFVFKDVQNSGGFKSYRVLIDPEKDTNNTNNEYSMFTNIISKPNILVIQGSETAGGGVIETLKADNSQFSLTVPGNAPSTLNEMMEYKAIVLCDVHIDDLPQGFVDNIDSYVKDYGGGLVTFGGENSYAVGGYKGTNLEKVLPLNMDKKGKNEIPKVSISLVIDKSGSMSSGEGSVSKLTLAKEAAMKSLDNLRQNDEINVIAFDDKYQNVVTRQSVKNTDEIREMISGINDGGGTSIYPALEQAYKSEKESNAKIKHVILLTDGQDDFGISNYEDLINNEQYKGITLSTVSVGEDADSFLLEQLAGMGKGRSYHTDKSTDIPRIFAKEVLLSTGTYIINEDFVPKVTSNSEILKGVTDYKSFPSLHGYIGTSKKDKAIEILSSNHDEPILAVWQHGLGKSACWTSDINGEWSSDFLTWNKSSQLIKNIIYSTIQEFNDEGKISVTQDGDEAVVEFYNDSVQDKTNVHGVYNGENGENGKIKLNQIEPGKYTGRVPLKNIGFYNFNIREEKNGKVDKSYNGAFSFQYSNEYKFNYNNKKLDTLIKESNGKFINKPKEVFTGKTKSSIKAVNLTIPLSIAAMILFLFDIVYRRLNLNLFNALNKIPIKKINTEKIVINKNSEAKQEKIKDTEKKDIKDNKKVKLKKIKKKEKNEILDVSSLLNNKNKR